MGGESAAKENKFSHLIKQHPCFSGEANVKYGRIHLPVSPACNIQCNFCQRTFNKWEKRPGVAHSVLSPEKALETVAKALELCPEITVVGIAGPGDTLATPHALSTFKLIHEAYPHLINCLSTNGLMLERKAEEIVGSGVKTVTVTVNAVDADILQHICSNVVYNGENITGKEAAEQLLSAQIAGIRKVSQLGVVVKINTVLIPGLNDQNIDEIARVTAEAGASLINIIPLIPQARMQDRKVPTCEELNEARAAAESYLTVFRHCQQCRADACGIPGTGRDLSSLLYEGQPVSAAPTFSHG